MNNSARVESTVGEMVNLMSVDAEHVRYIYIHGWGFVSCPFSIIISLVFLYHEVSRRLFFSEYLFVLMFKVPVNNLGLVATKPVFWVSGKAGLKPVSSATETS